MCPTRTWAVRYVPFPGAPPSPNWRVDENPSSSLLLLPSSFTAKWALVGTFNTFNHPPAPIDALTKATRTRRR